MKLLIAMLLVLMLFGCGHKKVKSGSAGSKDITLKKDLLQTANILQESQKVKSMDFPYLDKTIHKEFLDSYFKKKTGHNLLMTVENMSSIKSVYFKALINFEEKYEIHKRKFCIEKKITDQTKKQFFKEVPKAYIAESKEKVRESIIAVYLKNEKDCKHINQDLYQHSMLENLTLEIKLVDDILAFYETYQGEKSNQLKEDMLGLIQLRETCEHYFTLILPNDLDEYFFNTYIKQLDQKTLNFLQKQFKGKPFDSMTMLGLLKEI